MKNLINIICSILVFSQLHSQSYTPFPELPSRWHDSNTYCDFGVMMGQYYLNNITSEADTSISGTIYKKIFNEPSSAWGSCLIQPNGTFTYFPKNYVGALRQDSFQKKIFFLPRDSSSEQLLYNFNLQVGDTIPTLFYVSPPSNIKFSIVASIDSFVSNTINYKRYHLNIFDSIQQQFFLGNSWIEGIGSDGGLFHQIYNRFTMGAGEQSLTCFSTNGNTIFPIFSQTDCDMINSINHFYEINISAYPNPASEFITIRSFSTTSYTILSIQSQPLLSGTAQPNQSISISQLPNGIYFLSVFEQNPSKQIANLSTNIKFIKN
jgi:hypothetical protein